jgi:hypothetical protein
MEGKSDVFWRARSVSSEDPKSQPGCRLLGNIGSDSRSTNCIGGDRRRKKVSVWELDEEWDEEYTETFFRRATISDSVVDSTVKCISLKHVRNRKRQSVCTYDASSMLDIGGSWISSTVKGPIEEASKAPDNDLGVLSNDKEPNLGVSNTALRVSTGLIGRKYSRTSSSAVLP